ncbi:hypothetical protein CC1G_08074 [Coprinopsis cinerea okayama7|uniref:Uncharacterized protein n=1 Tax=Coprinopsis cinerea (strain Okayama-7 / 130 / ATCC MYA-4618 / FGSC 9003) TaxID=240176 RepID=A8NVN1_COPC7|nr:hypothetical protein CC1G_08074 [Coprinopsis cinerea okayama7\|eukprot:XP_001836689.1 hypothetical protein CC1G_08074 [Coprinopsis cinerea okayama7\
MAQNASPADPFYHLSRTNDPLTSVQEQHLRDEVSKIDKAIARLDGEMRELSARYQQLRVERVDLVHQKVSYSKILAPWRALPSEILTEILRYAIFPDEGDEGGCGRQGSGGGSGYGPYRSGGLSLDRTNRLSITQQLATLACVCKRWAGIVYGTPSLWCEVEIRERGKGMKIHELVSNLKKHFARSGTVPWSLSFSSDRLLNHSSGSTTSQTTSPLVAFLKDSTRWRSLSFTHQNLDILAPLFSTNPTRQDYTWPELQSLHLKGWYYGPAKAEPFINTQQPIFMGSMPQLTSLTLHTCDQKIANWRLPWSQLTTLRLTTADSYLDYMRILRWCPNLRYCDLSLPPTANPSSSSSSVSSTLPGGGDIDRILASNIVLPDLEVLQISHSTVVWPFFSAVTFPALKRLVVSTPPGKHNRTTDFPVGAALSQFLTRSKCDLVALALNNLPLQDEDYISIVEQAPNVRSLQITDHANAGCWWHEVNQRRLLSSVREVVLHGHFEKGTYVRKFLDRFLEERNAADYDADGIFYADEVTFSEEIFEWSSQYTLA